MQEILDEVVRELHKVKDEIINGKSCLFFPVFTLLCNITHYSFLFCSQPSDTKSAESVHPNLSNSRRRARSWTRIQRTAGRRNVLSMFLQVAETLCQHLSLLDSKTKKKKKKGRNEQRIWNRWGVYDKGEQRRREDGWGSWKGLKKRINHTFKNGETDNCTEFGVVVLSLCTYRLSQPSVATLCSLFSLKRKIFLFSKFLLFYYLKTVVMMLMTSILLILWKETESCTPFMSAFYILCLVVS